MGICIINFEKLKIINKKISYLIIFLKKKTIISNHNKDLFPNINNILLYVPMYKKLLEHKKDINL